MVKDNLKFLPGNGLQVKRETKIRNFNPSKGRLLHMRFPHRPPPPAIDSVNSRKATPCKAKNNLELGVTLALLSRAKESGETVGLRLIEELIL